jgi:nucleoredoxin
MLSASLSTKPYLLLYFSAAWCPTCHVVTPLLAGFYQQHAGGDAFEVAFVSADETEAKQRAYVADFKMPWPAVPFERAQTVCELYDIGTYPFLIVFAADGSVVTQSERAGTYVTPETVLAQFAKQLATPAKR